MKKYQCLQPVDNGKRHEIGDTIALSDEHAKPLLDTKAIAEIEATEEVDTIKKKK